MASGQKGCSVPEECSCWTSPVMCRWTMQTGPCSCGQWQKGEPCLFAQTANWQLLSHDRSICKDKREHSKLADLHGRCSSWSVGSCGGLNVSGPVSGMQMLPDKLCSMRGFTPRDRFQCLFHPATFPPQPSY